MSTKKSNNSRGYLYDTSYGGVRSSLTYLYRMSEKTMDREFDKELSKFLPGMKRVVADNKRESGASLDEGKKAMLFEVYKRICE